MIRTEDIEAEFEVQLVIIGDTLLRKKVVDVWYKASKEGGWNTIEELRELPFTVAVDAKGIRLLQHIKAATDGAVALAMIQMEKMPNYPRVNMDILVAGALLHDINKVVVFEGNVKNGFRKKNLPSEGIIYFPGVVIIRETRLPEGIVELVEYECRNAIGSPSNIESIIVHHADMTTFDTINYLNNITEKNE